MILNNITMQHKKNISLAFITAVVGSSIWFFGGIVEGAMAFLAVFLWCILFNYAVDLFAYKRSR